MWCLVIYLCLAFMWAEAQNGRTTPHQEHNGHGWDIRLAVPGEPGSDYPTLGTIPRTSFSCAGRNPGYYADLETNCQVFRVCTVGSTYGFQSFLCPNGTLFNQGVFVCDWWMNVDCKNSQQLINSNNEKFGNLRLGPQLMKDIKKMLTHPMLNPYDRSAMKSNLVVMQDYKPPLGQLFPNGALIAGPERPPNNVYVPSKQIQQNTVSDNPYDITYSASTPNPQYTAASGNINFQSFPSRDTDYFQRQNQRNQNNRNVRNEDNHNLQNVHVVSNSHTGRFIPNPVLNRSNGNTQLPQYHSRNIQKNNQRSESNKHHTQYTEPKIKHVNSRKHNDLGVAFTEQITTQNSNASLDKQPYTYSTTSNRPQFSNTMNSKAGKEHRENLVSTNKHIPTTMVTQTNGRLIKEAKLPKPKSRITIKTWIQKPAKTARQIVDSNSYTYERPFSSFSPPLSSPAFLSPTEKLTDDTTPYVYEKPTVSSQTEKIISTELVSEEPYIYPKPTSAAEQIHTIEFETTRTHVPTMNPTRPTFSGNLNSPFTSSTPTEASRYYLTPSPFKLIDRRYLSPLQNPTNLPLSYLSPNTVPQSVYQNAQLRVKPTIPSSTIVPFGYISEPSISPTKQSHINSSQNNLSFTDILTKEKLDITVTDIVKNTNNILKTASPPQEKIYRKSFKSLNNFEPTQTTIDSSDSLQYPLQPTEIISKNSQIVVPATSLVPPDESFIYQNYNELSKLPFYKESSLPNTIERTVSIKITIPERIATYLFKNNRETDYDKLEILNTGSSNYLVLSNTHNKLSSNTNSLNFIPIAKISGSNPAKNISDSQAFVYSFLTDSINVAREYNNIAQQEILSSTAKPTPPQFQTLDSEKLSDITNKISELTSSQFSSNQFMDKHSAKLISTQSTNIIQPISFTDNLKYSTEQTQGRHNKIPQNYKPLQNTKNNNYFSRPQIVNNQLNNNEVYSGQLYQWPVPEVTDQIYNRQTSMNLIDRNSIQQQTTQMLNLQRNINANNVADTFKQSNPALEIIKAQTLPVYSAKVQLEPPNRPEQLFTTIEHSQESLDDILNTENGISAHLQDKIVGTLPHPLEENKLVTYKKGQSYYLYTKFDDNTLNHNPPMNVQTYTDNKQYPNSLQDNNTQNFVSFELIPSVNYELDDEKEQQNILNAFQIDEFGAPREITKPKTNSEDKNARQSANVDFSVEHPTSSRCSDRITIDSLYSGPSSYTAPQSSIGSLEKQDSQYEFNSRLKDFDTSSAIGYSKDRPVRQFF